MGGIGNTVHLSFPSTSFEIIIFILPRIKLIHLLLLGNVYFMGSRYLRTYPAVMVRPPFNVLFKRWPLGAVHLPNVF